MKPKSATHSRRFIPGFALVVSLSLMILLTIVAVGLLTLSSLSLRSVSQDEAAAAARSNDEARAQFQALAEGKGILRKKHFAFDSSKPPADGWPQSSSKLAPANTRFGRRLVIQSLRWLGTNEI